MNKVVSRSLIIIMVIIGIGVFVFNFKPKIENRLNLIKLDSPLKISSCNPAENQILEITIPDNLLLDVAEDYGQYQAGTLLALSLQEKKDYSLVLKTIQNNLAIPIDGVWQKINCSGEIREFTLKNSLLNSQLADGTPVYEIDPETIDMVLAKYFKDEQIRREGYSISVFNNNGRLLKNIGGRVVGIEESENKVNDCLIKTNKEIKNSYTVKKISQIYHCRWQLLDADSNRADIELILSGN